MQGQKTIVIFFCTYGIHYHTQPPYADFLNVAQTLYARMMHKHFELQQNLKSWTILLGRYILQMYGYIYHQRPQTTSITFFAWGMPLEVLDSDDGLFSFPPLESFVLDVVVLFSAAGDEVVLLCAFFRLPGCEVVALLLEVSAL